MILSAPLMYITMRPSFLMMIDMRFRSLVKGNSAKTSYFYVLPRIFAVVEFCVDSRNS
jgi:hypothetical protein